MNQLFAIINNEPVLVFEHDIYNACVGQAKFFYHSKGLHYPYMIIDKYGTKHCVNVTINIKHN